MGKMGFYSKLTACGEKKIGEYWVDGFDKITGTIYEFDGCYYHGCPVCFEEGFYYGLVGCKMGILYDSMV